MNASTENLHFFNTRARKKERFVPLVIGEVKMYTCGPTVYDLAHIGNFRAFVFEDLLKRWLKYRGFKVTHVMNITDVDDKTIKGARAQKIPLKEYTDHYTDAFFEDIEVLNIEKADHYPKATEHLEEMVELIKKLIKKGYAYNSQDESVYYDVSKFKDYGKLSKIKVKDLKVGARVKADEYRKEQAHDFALWKAWEAKDGDVFWETELGKGRPGWHIECSAMSMKYLGETFDIHCGGVDNIFPHHENEIAQCEAATGKKFVNYWLHNEHLLVEGKKMAKRSGNYYTLRDLLAKGFEPKAIRYLLMSTRYRQQLNFTFEGLAAAKNAVDRLVSFVYRLRDADGKGCGAGLESRMDRVKKDFDEAMDDDLNISVALAALFDFVRDVHRLMDQKTPSKDEARKIYKLMIGFDNVLGIVGKVRTEKPPDEILELIKRREVARKAKDWAEADKIREQLRSMGITLEDTPQGVKWRVENS